jgi:hypothetical protein
MDSPYAIAQLIVVALLGAEYVVLALWDNKREPNPYQEWLDRPDATTHTVTNTPSRTL